MLTLLVAIALAASPLAAVAPESVAVADPGSNCVGGDCPPPPVSGGASGGSVEVTVRGSGVTSSGGSFEVSSATRAVAPVCFYARFFSGKEFADWWVTGLVEQVMPGLWQVGWGKSFSGYQTHATDTAGAWYIPSCDQSRWTGLADAYAAYRDAYFATHNPVYVEATDPVPTPAVDPAVLAQIAYDSMDLPHGTIRWNPSLRGGATVVNMDTWVWVENAPTRVSVTAQIAAGTWARVDAQLTGLQLSAPGADPATCPDTGVAWSPGATATSCSLVFFRSSANQPVKAGYSVPTATLTASAQWTASWVSSLNATPTALPTQAITTTAEVPVAEIESLVTLG